jgi:uncharacterized protein
MITTDSTDYGFCLWLFTILLFFRVIGQIVVVIFAPRWLPPMEQWQSGLLPYPVLLAGQAVVLTLMVWISADFARDAGFFLQPPPGMARAALWFSYVYFGGMIVRYVIRMTRRPDQRWLGGTIPIIFHSIVAAFLWTFATYHVG